MSYKTAVAFTIFLLALCPVAYSAERCSPWAARLESFEGSVLWREGANGPWRESTTNSIFCYGDTLRVIQGRAALRLENQTLVRLDADSTVRLLLPERSFFFQLVEGAVHFFSQTPRKLTVKAPYLNAAIDGTEFVISASTGATQVAVIEGVVSAQNSQGEVQLKAGEQAVGRIGKPPLRADLGAATGMAAWALSYPPVFIAENTPETIRSALLDNRPATALELILRMEPHSRTADLSALAAALALENGNVDGARALIQEALTADVDHTESLALRALINLLLGDLKTAQMHVLLQQAPGNATVQMVQSYYLQSRGELRGALVAAEQALALAPNNARALARTAELHLTLGDKRKARQAIKQALQSNAVTAKIHTLAGFIELNYFATKAAQMQIRRARLLGGDNAQAHLGMGLAFIQRNQIQRGREHLELAVLLDPNNSLMRSYLGKSYAEQRHLKLADAQYQLAQSLDENDPTPWFYQAQSKQLTNEIPQSLRLMQTAVEKNHNRGVYRSKLLLDSDAAARSAGQSLLYHDLGLAPLAAANAATAIAQSPADFAGHRALAMALATEPRQQTTRANEALLTNILQPLGATPLPPGFAASSLQVVPSVGPHRLGLNEYNALFSKRGVQGFASLGAGPDDIGTLSWQAHLVAPKSSFTAGQYRYTDDYYYGEDNVHYEVRELDSRYQANDTLQLQAHWRDRSSDQHWPASVGLGESNEQTEVRDIAVRARFTPGLKHTLLLDLMQRRLVNGFISRDTFDDGTTIVFDESPKTKRTKFDVAYLMTVASGWLKLGGVDVGSETHTFGTTRFEPDPFDQSYSSTRRTKESFAKLYAHGAVRFSDGINLQLGMEKLSTDLEVVDTTLPSAALGWTATDSLTLEAAYWEDTELFNLPYLSQTSLARFSRTNDQLQWARSQSSALRLNHTHSTFATNIELRSSNITSPRKILGSDEVYWQTFDENAAQISLFSNHWESFTLSANASWEAGESRDAAGGPEASNSVTQLRTVKVPITLGYFPTSSLRLMAEVTAVDQKARYTADGWKHSNFANLDLAANWRTTTTPVSLSLTLLNALGKEIEYISGGIATEGEIFENGFLEFAPERTLVAKATLRF